MCFLLPNLPKPTLKPTPKPTFIHQDRNAKLPIVICGDFNSTPTSGVYELLQNGGVPGDHPEFMEYNYGEVTFLFIYFLDFFLFYLFFLFFSFFLRWGGGWWWIGVDDVGDGVSEDLMVVVWWATNK
jgi:hypothetical protein